MGFFFFNIKKCFKFYYSRLRGDRRNKTWHAWSI